MADELKVNYVNIGQGDCTLVLCPDGKRIMIDCGYHTAAFDNDVLNLKLEKDAADEEVKRLTRMKVRDRPLSYDKQLKNARADASKAKKLYDQEKSAARDATDKALKDALSTFLDVTKKIDILVLTHHDEDHYNKIVGLRPEGITFGKVYYSGMLAKYIVVGANYAPPTLVEEYISLTINGVEKSKQEIIETAGDVTIKCQTGKLAIHENKSIKLAIEILASNVPTDVTELASGKFKFGSSDINGRSIVTMITYGVDKILVMGDSTVTTEAFLIKAYGTALQAETLRVGHHGSDTSSSQDLIDNVKPGIAIISSSLYNTYRLPVQSIMKRFIDDFNKRSLNKEIDHSLVCYDKDVLGLGKVESTIKQPVWQTWSLGNTLNEYSGK